MKINIISDIAGRFDELQLLLAKMPEADLILSVGDLVDRGLKSRQVIEWFMEQHKLGKAEVLYGNHEDMFIEAVSKKIFSDWVFNGGMATALSYVPACKDCHSVEDFKKVMSDHDMVYTSDVMKHAIIPEEVINWLKARPMYFQTDDLFVSHAPITSLKDIPQDPYRKDDCFIWNRREPREKQDKFLINGHNGTLCEYKTKGGEVIGMCIDNSHKGILTGLHWPNKEIFEQPYLS